MGRVILQEFVTVDGFAAGPEGSTEFISRTTDSDPRIDQDLLKFIGTIDMILLGADTYRMFAGFWPEATTDAEIVADALNATPKVVFSRTLERAPWGRWDEARVVRKDAAGEIRSLKREQGRDMVIWGSLSLARSLMDEGVIDEYQLFVCPVRLGSGDRLFADGLATERLRLTETKTYESGTVLLRYRPA
jgi:dihydrofolate reductase